MRLISFAEGLQYFHPELRELGLVSFVMSQSFHQENAYGVHRHWTSSMPSNIQVVTCTCLGHKAK